MADARPRLPLTAGQHGDSTQTLTQQYSQRFPLLLPSGTSLASACVCHAGISPSPCCGGEARATCAPHPKVVVSEGYGRALRSSTRCNGRDGCACCAPSITKLPNAETFATRMRNASQFVPCIFAVPAVIGPIMGPMFCHSVAPPDCVGHAPMHVAAATRQATPFFVLHQQHL